jgi:hypothetical protein
MNEAIDQAMGILRDTSDPHRNYGTPESNLTLTADLCNKVLGTDLKASDIAMIYAMGKMAREAKTHKQDNIIDAINYLNIYDGLIQKTIETNTDRGESTEEQESEQSGAEKFSYKYEYRGATKDRLKSQSS